MAKKQYCCHCFTINDSHSRLCQHCAKPLHTENAQHQLPVSSVLHGRYLIGKCLGEGGFGITYAGYDLVLKMKVAVKEYYPFGGASRDVSGAVLPLDGERNHAFTQGQQRFMKEADILSKMQQILSVVRVLDFFRENGTAYIVMEYLEGISLRAYVRRNGKTSFAQVLSMMSPILEDLERIHQMGILHRDLSPSNLILSPDGTLRLLDFGAAKSLDQAEGEDNALLLKPNFAPVEQYTTKEKQGAWTDVYAISATMYFLLTGVEPEPSMDRRHTDRMKPPRTLGAEISPQAEWVLMKGLALEPEKRIRSMRELTRRLKNPPVLRSSAKLFAGAVAAVLVLSLSVFFLVGRDAIGKDSRSSGSGMTSGTTAEARKPELPPALAEDASPVRIYSDMSPVAGFTPRVVCEEYDVRITAENVYVGENLISLVLRFHNGMEVPARLFSFRFVDPDTGKNHDLLDICANNNTEAHGESFYRVDLSMDQMMLLGKKSISGIPLSVYVCDDRRTEEDRLIETVHMSIPLPREIQIPERDHARRSLSVLIGERKIAVHGARLIRDSHQGILFLSEEDRTYGSVQIVDARVDGVSYTPDGYQSVSLAQDSVSALLFNFYSNSTRDEWNVNHCKAPFPEEFTITLVDLYDEKVTVRFQVDEDGWCLPISAE